MDKYNLWMCSIPDIGRESIRKLLMYFEDAKEVFKAPDTEIQKCIFLEEGTREAVLRSRKKWNFERAEHEIKEKGIRFISFENPLYPERLKSLPDYPYGLFLKGRLPEEDRLSVAIIGARKCSAYGKRMAEEIAEELSWAGVQIISGMAYGVDGYAQSAALDAGGSSFAVLGSGADVCYPDGNWRLYEELCERGGIISEYPPGTPPISWHFPMRNRIVSGLADAVIVVEAKERSGSLITADLALDQGGNLCGSGADDGYAECRMQPSDQYGSRNCRVGGKTAGGLRTERKNGEKIRKTKDCT